MENELYTFVMCNHDGHSVKTTYCNRAEADRRFDDLCRRMDNDAAADYLAYYCGSVGGLVNSYYNNAPSPLR